jgi:hypothetical protein
VRHRHFYNGALAFLVGVITSNQARAERALSVSRLNGDVRIDGLDTDPPWQNTPAIGDFTQREPLEGTPSSPTEVRIGYDDTSLYVLVKAFDVRPQGIIRRRTRRDETVTSDWVHVYLAADNHDERYAYRFSVNAAGVKQDARLVDGNTEDLAFNAVWDAQVSLDDRGWIAEFRIPFHQLAYTGEPNFRFQVIRYQARTGEQSTLFPYPRAATLPVRYMLPLRGMSGLPSPTHVELLPYVSTAMNRLPWHAAPTYRMGTDVKVAFSPDVQLQATIHPDFGQVESDPSELNLTVYETFLTERRPFFLDGVELLDFGLRQGVTNDKLFYTRRIGQPPRAVPGFDSDEVVSLPTQTTLLGATKLLVRRDPGYTLALLHALTAESSAVVREAGERRSVSAAPATQYFVARSTKTFDRGRTNVGTALTAVERDLGARLDSHFVKSATTFGLDLERREKRVRLTTKVFASHLEGSPSAIQKVQENSVHYFQRPDARHLSLEPNRKTLDGYGMTVIGSTYTGVPWRASWGGTAISPGFEPNDLGFLQKADDINAFASLQYIIDSPTRNYRNLTFETYAAANFTFGAEPTSRYAYVAMNWVGPDTSTARLQLQRDTERLDPRVLRGGSSMRIPGKSSITLSVTTNDRRSVAFDLSTWGGRNDGNVAYWVGGQLNLRVRPVSFVQLSFGPYYQHNLDGWAFIERAESGNAIVARMPRDTVSLTVRASIALTTDLSLQFYSMPYFTAGQRTDFAEVVAPKSERFEDHFAKVDYAGARKFWFAQARTNAVLRWEYRPGSSAFVVWSREQARSSESIGAIEMHHDALRLWNAPNVDTVMLKWAHWMSY